MKDRRTTISRWLQLITELPRSTKRFIMVVADVVMIPLALYTAITLRLGTVDHDFGSRGWLYVVVLLTSLPVFARLGLYRAVTRYIGARAVLAVFAGVTLSVALVTLLNFTLAHRMVPTSALVIYWALALLYVAGSRYLVRLALQSANGAGERVAIYGAGEAGVRLSVALQSGKEFKPVAFVDDHHALHGSVINGIEVFSPSELPTIIPEFSITRILLAVPSETRRRRREILAHLESLGTHVQTIPDLSDLAAGRARVDEIHEVEVSDLLGRDPVPPNLALLRACIREKVRADHGCRRFDRLRAVPPDRATRAETPTAARNVGDCSLQHREGTSSSPAPAKVCSLRSLRCLVTRTTSIAYAKSCRRMACRPCITRPPTSTCRSSSRT